MKAVRFALGSLLFGAFSAMASLAQVQRSYLDLGESEDNRLLGGQVTLLTALRATWSSYWNCSGQAGAAAVGVADSYSV
jgi:hypothetical protein